MKATFRDNLLLPLTLCLAVAAVTTFDFTFSDMTIWSRQSCQALTGDEVKRITSGGCSR